MSLFDGKRLPIELFKVDERIRTGWYSDAYFNNMRVILETLSQEDYEFENNPIGDIHVTMQIFTRRKPKSLIAGVDEALAILKTCTGYFDGNGDFVNTFDKLEVEAMQDGEFTYYNNNPKRVNPVIKIRGRYRDFAHLETVILGALTEATRVATNVYNTLVASNGKPVLFFPARFAHYKLQALHGYAYNIAVERFDYDYDLNTSPSVSTDEQGGWWGGNGGGTVAHASIACFMGNTAETMMQFSRIMPVNIPRIALVDFHNDCITTTLDVMKTMFDKYWDLLKAGDEDEAQKYELYGVRPDTSSSLRDRSIMPLGIREADMGVCPRLVWRLREAIDNAYGDWELTDEAIDVAKDWCRDVKIVATGGFDVERISEFELMGVPVDIYGVGSSLLRNDDNTSNDFTADIVSIAVKDESGNYQYTPMAKVGRIECYSDALEVVK